MNRRKPPDPKPTLRAKVWVQTGTGQVMTEAGADLLEQIHACGSLSEAARRLGFAYRRAWLLVDAMNKGWPKPLVTTAVGGKRGGGARLTEFGLFALAAYREVQFRTEHFIDTLGDPFAHAP